MRCRRIFFNPPFNLFKPAGVPPKEILILTVDELEAIRLKDHEGLDQTKSAESMNVSQPTFQRIYNSARKKIADAIINGKALKIEGGNYRIEKNISGIGFHGRRGRRFLQ